jgi:hypothetical protein
MKNVMSNTDAKPALQTALTPDQQQYFDLLGPPAIVEGEDEARYDRLLGHRPDRAAG